MRKEHEIGELYIENYNTGGYSIASDKNLYSYIGYNALDPLDELRMITEEVNRKLNNEKINNILNLI